MASYSRSWFFYIFYIWLADVALELFDMYDFWERFSVLLVL